MSVAATRRKLGLTVTLTASLAVAVCGGVVGLAGVAQAREGVGNGNLATVQEAELPAEARQTAQLIRSGGPFPYSKDGSVFGNREALLPRQARGHYREYTVPTPGERDRGARRIVCGGRQPRNPEACFYSDDHYASFRRIAP
jgi:ribonuclease T1